VGGTVLRGTALRGMDPDDAEQTALIGLIDFARSAVGRRCAVWVVALEIFFLCGS
jgi:hypothetical protein